MGNSSIAMSWIQYDADTDFPIQNVPYGVFVPAGSDQARCGVRVGDTVVDLAAIESELPASVAGAFGQPSLNQFMSLGAAVWKETRARIIELLTTDEGSEKLASALHQADTVTMMIPSKIGDYTDFYASREHATNVGCMFRDPANALLPNWLHLPVGYHGRASSVVVSGTPIRRPKGQTKPEDGPPVHVPCRLLDF